MPAKLSCCVSVAKSGNALLNEVKSRRGLTLPRTTVKRAEQHQQGQHSTTFAEMHPLSFGGFIIDTPGIKGFGMVDFEKEEISGCFPEFFKLKQDCKFHNCMHIDEPKCAVKLGLEADRIAPSRYFSYLQIVFNEVGNFIYVEYEHR